MLSWDSSILPPPPPELEQRTQDPVRRSSDFKFGNVEGSRSRGEQDPGSAVFWKHES